MKIIVVIGILLALAGCAHVPDNSSRTQLTDSSFGLRMIPLSPF